MIIKNICAKIIGVGGVIVLPDETKKVYVSEDNKALKAMERLGEIVIIPEVEEKKPEEKKAEEKKPVEKATRAKKTAEE